MKLDVEQKPSVTTDRLAGLITLQKRLLAVKTVQEAEYILVNDSMYTFPARQGLLFRHGKLGAHSGSTDVDQPSPYLHWINQVVKAVGVQNRQGDTSPVLFTSADIPESSSGLREEWQEYWPVHALWVPLVWQGQTEGGLLMVRERPWSEAEIKLLSHWVDTSLPVLSRLSRRPVKLMRPAMIWLGVAVLCALCLFIPVKLSVLAQAEVIPDESSIIRAPLNGIISERLVEPNAQVQSDDVLIRLDDAELEGRLEAARQAEAIASAEYRRARQLAFRDPGASAEVPVLSARLEQTREQVQFLEKELQRVTVTSPRGGVAIIGNPDDWVGRPVKLGERLMEVADPKGAQLEIWLPTADTIPLPTGATVSLFLNVDPSRARHAQLSHVNYRAETAPTGELAYRARAKLDQSEPLPRVGWRGTAKVEGEQVSLAYYLFRRPWMALRSWVGW